MCHTRGESQGTCYMYASAKCIRLPTLDLEPRVRCHQKSKKGVLMAPQKGLMFSKTFFQKKRVESVALLHNTFWTNLFSTC